ncbi:MAG: cytochrome b/b6 domain-containing protein [Deltaproteobacteria bacterium]|nr:cytochrome b/b6 domain-containing protein [Deltaproteobacteria bacterium]
MKFSRRSFLTGVAAAAGAAVLPKGRAEAKAAGDSYATLIDLTKCDGCEGKGTPLCVRACRDANAAKFPEPDPAKIKDYWPQKMHEDWSGKRQVTDRLTPYNWLFVQTVEVPFEGGLRKVSIPRRCMHCDNPACAKLCPFGAAKKTAEGPVLKAILLGKPEPPHGKFLAEQRLAYAAFGATSLVLILTGLLKTYKNLGAIVVNPEVLQVVTLAHTAATMLFVLLVFLHLGAFLPKANRPLLPSMFTGRVDGEYARRRHRRWLAGSSESRREPT